MRTLATLALKEDGAAHDVTSKYSATKTAGTLTLQAQEDMTLAGSIILPFFYPSPPCHITFFCQDGTKLKAHTDFASIQSHDSVFLLSRERPCLNVIQILSGIATLTARYVEKIRHSQARLLDTRKTIPAMRYLSKYATALSGGLNHRHHLKDSLFIKDNHILASGGDLDRLLTSMAKKIKGHKAHAPPWHSIIVECDRLEQVATALRHEISYILLDNMTPAMLNQSVRHIRGRAVAEASGGVTLDNISDIATTGVDYISLSAITLQAPAVNISARWEAR